MKMPVFNFDLLESLFNASPEDKRCKYLGRDEVGAYCAKDLKPGSIIEMSRRLVCDFYSLQFWCLDGVTSEKCIVYLGKRL